MDPYNLLYLSSAIALIGTISGIIIYTKLRLASRILGDKSLMLAGLGILVFGVALAVEGLGNLAFQPTFPETIPGKRPVEITSLVINRGTLISLPLYMISYVLMAVSHYIGSIEIQPRRKMMAILPAIIIVYVDINILSFMVLVAASYLAIVKYGKATSPATLFYMIAGLSHILPAVYTYVGSLEWWLIPLSTILRGIAAILLLASSFMGK
ncbi:MAG: hypothetical protein F7C37_03565 [Desulfurococcales archaeon]|nr:hypothetical protein [Desulfurococcales archaeon]MCE4622690.1 hypothetical protein [Desulfurococcales archaeon]MCE4626904.1 hypothetical protein [Desulfurococcales archaeon]